MSVFPCERSRRWREMEQHNSPLLTTQQHPHTTSRTDTPRTTLHGTRHSHPSVREQIHHGRLYYTGKDCDADVDEAQLRDRRHGGVPDASVTVAEIARLRSSAARRTCSESRYYRGSGRAYGGQVVQRHHPAQPNTTQTPPTGSACSEVGFPLETSTVESHRRDYRIRYGTVPVLLIDLFNSTIKM